MSARSAVPVGGRETISAGFVDGVSSGTRVGRLTVGVGASVGSGDCVSGVGSVARIGWVTVGDGVNCWTVGVEASPMLGCAVGLGAAAREPQAAPTMSIRIISAGVRYCIALRSLIMQ